jgi:predicted DNA-binding protein (MmcQ/YjbR family)
MSLHSAKNFSKFVGGMPGVILVEQWGSLVAKVGGKVFALVAVDGADVVFKVGEISFDGLTTLEGIAQAPYFAKRQWVSVAQGAALSDAELKAYIKASYETIAGKLTKKLRAELGISVE